MNLRQLHYLVAIAAEGSFTRAAEQLLVAQPSLSQQIKSLEHELGGPLLERLPTGVRLTAAGKAFLPEARAAVAHADRARRNARSALGLEAGEIEVATVTSVAFGVLPPAFDRWHDRYPGSTSPSSPATSSRRDWARRSDTSSHRSRASSSRSPVRTGHRSPPRSWRCSRSRPGTAGRPPRPSSSSTGQAAANSDFPASAPC